MCLSGKAGSIVATGNRKPVLPRYLSGKESACQCRRHRFFPGLGRTPGGGNSNLLQYCCLGNPKDREATVHGVSKSWTALSTHTHTDTHRPHLMCRGVRIKLGGSRDSCAPPLGDIFSEEVTTAQSTEILSTTRFRPLLTKKENKAQRGADSLLLHSSKGVLSEAHLSPDQVRGKRTQLYLEEKGHQLLRDLVCSLGPVKEFSTVYCDPHSQRLWHSQ